MTNGTSNPGNALCPHDWKIVDTYVDPMRSAAENPRFNLKCRKCGAERQVFGHTALREISNPTPLHGLG